MVERPERKNGNDRIFRHGQQAGQEQEPVAANATTNPAYCP